MVRLINFNKTNIDPNDFTKATYTYRFPISFRFEEGDHISVSAISLWYSNPAISQEYNNQKFSYYFPNASGVMVEYPITIDDGTYSVPQLNFFLQQQLITNGHYLQDDSNGDYVYYIELQENPIVYGVQLNTYPVPTSLPTGYSNPASMPFPPTSRTPSLSILPGNEFRLIVGFNTGVYPPLATTQTTVFSKTSDFTPQVSPVSSYTIQCNLVQNRLSIPMGQIYAFAPNKEYGSLLSPQQNSFVWNKITAGLYSEIQIKITDQLFRRLLFKDTNNLIQLAVWRRSEDGPLICV